METSVIFRVLLLCAAAGGFQHVQATASALLREGVPAGGEVAPDVVVVGEVVPRAEVVVAGDLLDAAVERAQDDIPAAGVAVVVQVSFPVSAAEQGGIPALADGLRYAVEGPGAAAVGPGDACRDGSDWACSVAAVVAEPGSLARVAAFPDDAPVAVRHAVPSD